MLWMLLEFIGADEDGNEVYVKGSASTSQLLRFKEQAQVLNDVLRLCNSNLRYYDMEDLPKSIVSEEKALPYRRDI